MTTAEQTLEEMDANRIRRKYIGKTIIVSFAIFLGSGLIRNSTHWTESAFGIIVALFGILVLAQQIHYAMLWELYHEKAQLARHATEVLMKTYSAQKEKTEALLREMEAEYAKFTKVKENVKQ